MGKIAASLCLILIVFLGEEPVSSGQVLDLFHNQAYNVATGDTFVGCVANNLCKIHVGRVK